MMFLQIIAGVAVLFGVSWLPLGLFSLLADLLFSPGASHQISPQSLYIALAVCHIFAMTSAVSNPIVYGWLNSNIRRELVQLIPSSCIRRPNAEASQEPSPTIHLCQNGQRPQHQNPATTYTAL